MVLTEVIDLTNPPTVELFRKWDQKEVAYIQLLRFIRIFSTDSNRVVVSRPGKHASVIEFSNQRSKNVDMDVENINQHPNSIIPGEPMSRFSSTIMNMDS